MVVDVRENGLTRLLVRPWDGGEPDEIAFDDPAYVAWFDTNTNFDTPTLIEAWRTAPYLYNGSYLTVKDLLGDGRHGLTETTTKALSSKDIEDLAEFVLSL